MEDLEEVDPRGPFTAIFRIASGMVVGMWIAALVLHAVEGTDGMNYMFGGMGIGSFVGFLSTLRFRTHT